MKRITDWAREGLRAQLRAGDWVVDATLGNGHDSETLLEAVGPTGRVFALDLQAQAVGAAEEQFQDHPGFTAIQADHGDLAEHLPPGARGRLKAVVFNLGYLPGSDHGIMTRPESTLRALATSLEWLAPGGVLSCMAYPGTAEGAEEAKAVEAWVAGLDRREVHVTRIESTGSRRPAPRLLWIERLPR